MRKILIALALCMLPMAAYADEPTNAYESQQEPISATVDEHGMPMYENGVDVSYGAPGIEEQASQEAAALESPQTLNSYDGTFDFMGRVETYYSSEVLRHYRTDEWTADQNGFYRTDEGYFVVAASDIPQGTVFLGSMGLCIVMDDGCPEGVTDYYVDGTWR